MDAMVAKPRPATALLPFGLVVLGAAVATIVGAFVFQAYGYAPCELCLKERIPYYAGMAVAIAAIAAAWTGPAWAPRACFAVLALIFLFSAGFGIYHAGVEWGFWPGPSDCSGPLDHASSNQDFLRQLHTFRAVRCDAVAIRILGLSLAGWNALISFAIAAVAMCGVVRGRTGASTGYV